MNICHGSKFDMQPGSRSGLIMDKHPVHRDKTDS
jgi:hypothetical protein